MNPGSTEGVLNQVAALPAMSTGALRARWRDLFGTEPPPFNRQFLVNRLAYRIQELAFGSLSEQARARLSALAEDGTAAPDAARGRIDNRPVAGTRLIREWQGVEHQVTVLADGFEWQGRKYKSLSAAARAITGTRWNGLVFFGLKKHARKA